MAGGFPRNCSRDILQDFITKEIIGKHDGVHDGKAIYREGSTAYPYFTSRDALWRFLRNQPTIKYEDKGIWYTFPKSKEERAMSMTLSALKKAILELNPDEKPIVKWDVGQIFIKGMLIARTPPTNLTKAEVSHEQIVKANLSYSKDELLKKFLEIKTPNADDVKDWE